MKTENKIIHSAEPWIIRVATNFKAVGIMSQSMIAIKDEVDFICLITPLSEETEQDRANALRIVDCVNACAGIENPAEFTKEAQAIRNDLQTYENLIPQLVEELNGFRAQENEKQSADLRSALKPSKFAILNHQSLDMHRNEDGYTETFATEGQALDVAQQFVSMFQIVPLNL